jgi:beta-glucanase (GH16 family)
MSFRAWFGIGLLFASMSGAAAQATVSRPPGDPSASLDDPAVTAPFRHDFRTDGIDGAWRRSAHTFDGNACQFDPSMASAGADGLVLRAQKAPGRSGAKPYVGAELMSDRLFGFGRFTVRMKSPIGPGLVSSFFLMNEWKPGRWLHKEIDFEFLGKGRGQIQTNIHRFFSDSGNAAGVPRVHPSGFDYGADFREYAVLWLPDRVEWYVDGRKAREETEKVPDEPMRILMNTWVPDPAFAWTRDWVGPLRMDSLPARAEYLWVRYEPLAR